MGVLCLFFAEKGFSRFLYFFFFFNLNSNPNMKLELLDCYVGMIPLPWEKKEQRQQTNSSPVWGTRGLVPPTPSGPKSFSLEKKEEAKVPT